MNSLAQIRAPVTPVVALCGTTQRSVSRCTTSLPAQKVCFSVRSLKNVRQNANTFLKVSSSMDSVLSPLGEESGFQQAGEQIPVPMGMKRYETMFLMLPDASEDEISKEIVKLEEIVTLNGAVHVDTLNRGRQPLAYNIKGFPEAVYVQMNYIAPGTAPKQLETEIAKPVLGDRKLTMRFMTHNYGQ
eukprot:CAMPEP_0196572116 /NCGR_PEP_ID=MMETSP1081-20130531/2221_1 /TAXON_ID=36882 /ORGANISM="Pyramimonas amylifera, Strain CCMP720" /LENGTH=186 /DNA_ID=CAMNT_0041889321 /DNA_START=107 /DNA_END=667 /DNA_ORIENTATION=-